jgi:acetyl esterase/lipase
MIRRILVVVGLLLVGVTAGCGGSTPAPQIVPFRLGAAHRDVAYCDSQKLDLYIPRSAATRPLPVAIFVHGGGLSQGDKSNLPPVFLDPLAENGYAVASVNYRLAPSSQFPAQIEDVKCAIRYLRAKAETYGLDKNEMFGFGTSSGGQLVALAALTGSRSAWDVGAYRSEPSTLTAAADIFGPANLTERSSGYKPSELQDVFGGSDRQKLVQASPTHYVAPNAPPMLVIQGADDTTVLKSQSIELYRDLKAAGDTAQLVLVRNMGHMFVQVGSKPIDPNFQEIVQDLVTFFDSQRKG